jgi:serralysin
MRRLILPTLIALTIFALPLPASQHLWDIQEVYTNADGSVQFIEFFTASSGQQFLNGFTLTEMSGATTLSSFTFPNDLPLNSPLAGHPNTASTTANQTFLVATSNFTSLYGIVPDYIIPAGFLTAGSGRVLDFNVSPLESINLDSLPTNGVQSLNGIPGDEDPSHFSINSTATPKNFRGETAVIPEPGTAAIFIFGFLGLLGLRRVRAA